MLSGLDRSFTKLEGQKRVLLAGLASYSLEQLSFRPSEECWCALQILDHLHKTERGIFEIIRNGPGSPHALSLKDHAGAIFLTGLFMLPTRVRVPRSASVVLPGVAPDKAEVEIGWAATRRELETVIRSFTPELARLGVFRHPVSGWMTMSQTLSFFSAHLTHHGYQLRRLRGAYERSAQGDKTAMR